MLLNRRLQELREEKDLQQKYIAKLLDITDSTYSLYEKGTTIPPLPKLITLAKFYDVTLDYLSGLSEHRIEVKPANSTQQDLIKIYKSLNSDFKKTLMNVAEALFYSQQKRDTDIES